MFPSNAKTWIVSLGGCSKRYVASEVTARLFLLSSAKLSLDYFRTVNDFVVKLGIIESKKTVKELQVSLFTH